MWLGVTRLSLIPSRKPTKILRSHLKDFASFQNIDLINVILPNGTKTVSTIIGTITFSKNFFLKNILYIPAILTIGVSSIKLYKSIITDKRKENIKIEVIRHTIISTIMIAVLVLSTIIENFISLKIIKKIIKYF